MSRIMRCAQGVALVGALVAACAATVRDGVPRDVCPAIDPRDANTPAAPQPTHEATHEVAFFDALNRDASRRSEALASLRTRVEGAPDDARAVLLLGVAHLWVAAENPPDAAVALEHLILARHYLARAIVLNPVDDRIPTWLHSAEISLAQAEGREADAADALAKLRAHAQRDPCFHSVAFAISVWDEPRESDALAEAQKYLEHAAACNAEDPSVRNMDRWPYNVQGFLVGMSDVALKRGDRSRALGSLIAAESWPGTESWPHRGKVEIRRRDFDARAELFADEDPAFIFERGGPVSCVSCHQGAADPAR